MINNDLLTLIYPAIFACLLIIFTHAPLGIEVIKRGIIFIDLAVAQIAGLGIITANIIFSNPSNIIIQVIALSFAVMSGLFFRKMEMIIPKQLEAIIGTAFILASSIGILMVANNPHGAKELLNILSGEILFITWEKVIHHLPIYIFIMSIWFFRPIYRKGLGFYLLFSLAITSSVQLVGVYVVFASLILPALASLDYKKPYIAAWSCGSLSIIVGITLSIIFDMPTGPILVLSFLIITLMFLIVRKTLNS